MKHLKTFYKNLQKLNLSNKTITTQILEDIQCNNIPDCLPKYLKYLNTKNIKEKKLINYIFRNSDDINKLVLVNTNIQDFTSNELIFQIEAVYLSLYVEEVGMYLSEYIVNYIMTEIKSHKIEFMENEFQTIENYGFFECLKIPVSKESTAIMTPLISFDAFNMSIIPFKNKLVNDKYLKNELIAKIILFLCSENFLQKATERYTFVINILMDIFKFYPYNKVIEEAIYIGLLLIGKNVNEEVLNVFVFKRTPKEEEIEKLENINEKNTGISLNISSNCIRMSLPFDLTSAFNCNSNLELNEYSILLIEKYISIKKINSLIVNKLVITLNSNSFERSFLASRLLLKIINADLTCYCTYNKMYLKNIFNGEDSYNMNIFLEDFRTNNELEVTYPNSSLQDISKDISISHQEIYNKLLKFQDDPDFDLIYELPFKNITNIKFFNSDTLKSTLKKIDLISTNLRICKVCYLRDISKNKELIKNYRKDFSYKLFYINLSNLQELSRYTSQSTIYLIINVLLRNDIKCLFLENLIYKLNHSINIPTLIKILLLNNQYIEKNKTMINNFFSDYIPSNIPLSFVDDFLSLYSLNILYTLNEIVDFLYKKIVIKNSVIAQTTLNRFLNFFRVLTNKQLIDEKYIKFIIEKYKVIEIYSEFDDIEIVGRTINPISFKCPFSDSNENVSDNIFSGLNKVQNISSESLNNNILDVNDKKNEYINNTEAEYINNQEDIFETVENKNSSIEPQIENKQINNEIPACLSKMKEENVILSKFPFRGKYPSNNLLNDLQLNIILESNELKIRLLIPQTLYTDKFSINIDNRYLKLITEETIIKKISYVDIEKLLRFDFIHENTQRKNVTPIKFRINAYKTAFISSETFESKYSDFGIRKFNELFEEYFMSFKVNEKKSNLMRLKYLDEDKCITEIFDKLIIGKKRGDYIMFKTSETQIIKLFN